MVGVTPSSQVEHWATQGAADAMSLGHLVDSITPGKRADLVLIDTLAPSEQVKQAVCALKLL